jgi:hypothetical protein
MTKPAFVAFLASALIHAPVIAFFVILIIKPLFVPVRLAVSLSILVVFAVSTVRGVRVGQKHLAAFWLGLLVAMGMFMCLLTLMDWAVGMPPAQQLTIEGFARYLGQIRLGLSELSFYILLFLFVLGASAAGYVVGSRSGGDTNKFFAVILITAVNLICIACGRAEVGYVWVEFFEDLACRDKITGDMQCIRAELALRVREEERGRLQSDGHKLPPVFRERVLSRLETSGVIPIDFDDTAKLSDIQRDVSVVIDSIIVSPRVELSLNSCGERVEDMTDEEMKKRFDEMDEETKKNLMSLPPTLGYVDQ